MVGNFTFTYMFDSKSRFVRSKMASSVKLSVQLFVGSFFDLLVDILFVMTHKNGLWKVRP